jgi:FkbM family methyltransferase
VTPERRRTGVPERVSTFVRRTVVVAFAHLTRRWPTFRPATSIAFRAGNAFAHSPTQVRTVARLQTGSEIVLDLSDLAHRHINLYGLVEEGTTRLVHRLAKPGWCVLDVGANAGYYALICADLGGPAADVHAFEPQPAFAASLRESVARNNVPVTVVEAACGARDGETTLFESTERNWAALATVIPDYFTVTTVPRAVQLIRLDNYCEAHNLHADLVKVDVEGYEAEVVAGLDLTLRRSRPHLICEVRLRDTRAATLFAQLHRLGYKAARIADDGTLTPFSRTASDDVLNLYFSPAERS